MLSSHSVTSRRVENIKVDKISNNLLDFRDTSLVIQDEKSKEFQELKSSIKELGLLTPISVAFDEKNYTLIDGRRRFVAVKQLGLTEIPALIIEGKSEKELAIITLVQNLHRKNLKVGEKVKGVVKLFEVHGFTIDEVLKYTKILNNEGGTIKNVDLKFIQIFKSLGYDSNSLYIMFQVARDLDEKVFEEAAKYNLGLGHLQLLTKTILKQHPDLQQGLIHQIKDIRNKPEAAIIINDAITNLESGALVKDDETNKYVYESSKKEFSSEHPEVEPTALKKYLNIRKSITPFLRATTFKTLTQNRATEPDKEKRPTRYALEDIKFSKDERREMINALGEEELIALRYNLRIMRDAIDDTLNLIDKTLDNN